MTTTGKAGEYVHRLDGHAAGTPDRIDRAANASILLPHNAPVISEQEARSTAEELVRAMSSEPDVPPLAIMGVEEHPECWVFFYQTVRYIETGSIMDGVAGNAPILVERTTGQPHWTGTARSISYYLTEYANGRHTCELCRSSGATM
ncbi:YrhB domain-containing protein [Micromonospora luteifusca]|uniref:YrhB domain-containing protein n=1 Tax=Micromonospora luteifusca TaxID=709860 RepID=UPI0033BEDE0A